MQDSEVIKTGEKIINDLIKLLGVDAELKVAVEIDEDEKKYLRVDIEGDELGFLIGYRGKTLNSIQSIFTQMLVRQLEGEEVMAVCIDVNNYRERRKSYLKSLALRAATEAKESGQNIELPALSPYERRIVHLALKKEEGVSTESEGEGDERHVVVKPTR